MVGEDSITQMRSRWLKYLAAMLRLGNAADDGGEDMSYQALLILDKRLRGTGPGAKSPAAFTVYAVSIT